MQLNLYMNNLDKNYRKYVRLQVLMRHFFQQLLYYVETHHFRRNHKK